MIVADILKVFWLSDIHYSDEASQFHGVTQEYRVFSNAGQRVQDALNQAARSGADLVVIGGDLIDDGAADFDAEVTKYEADVAASNYSGDFFHISGNHGINQLRNTAVGDASAPHTLIFDKLSNVQQASVSNVWPLNITNQCSYTVDKTIGGTTFRLIFLSWADTNRQGPDFGLGSYRSTMKVAALTTIPVVGTSVLIGGTGGQTMNVTASNAMTNNISGELNTLASNTAFASGETLDDDQDTMVPDPATIQDQTQVLTFTNAITTPPNVGDVLTGDTSGATLTVTAESTPTVTGTLTGWFQVGETVTSDAPARWVPSNNTLVSLSLVTTNHDDQLVWLAETALNTSNPILVFAHGHFTTIAGAAYAFHHNTAIIKSLRAIFANKQAADNNIIGVFSGHYHRGTEVQLIDNVSYNGFRGSVIATSLGDTGQNAYYLIEANNIPNNYRTTEFSRNVYRPRYDSTKFKNLFSRTRGRYS